MRARSGGPPADWAKMAATSEVFRPKRARSDDAQRLRVDLALVVEIVNRSTRDAQRLSWCYIDRRRPQSLADQPRMGRCEPVSSAPDGGDPAYPQECDEVRVRPGLEQYGLMLGTYPPGVIEDLSNGHAHICTTGRRLGLISNFVVSSYRSVYNGGALSSCGMRCRLMRCPSPSSVDWRSRTSRLSRRWAVTPVAGTDTSKVSV